MTTTRLLRALIAAAALAVAFVPASTASAAPRLTISVHTSPYGTVLTDGHGRAFYLFTRDVGKSSRCYGACAKAWPVAVTGGSPRAGRGARPGLIGTTRRRGGGRQATYAGHPLYYYVTDRSPGQVTCQNVSEFGGRWLVLRASGRAVR